MFNQKYNLKYPYLFLMCFLISTTLLLNSCRRFILKDEGVEDKSIEELSDLSRAKTNLDGLNTSIYTIRQTLGSDGLLTGSFLVPADGISFFLSILLRSNSRIKFLSLTDPDGLDILSSSSTPNLYNEASGRLGSSGFANVLVPQSPSFIAKPGTWTFKAYSNDRVKLVIRSGIAPTSVTIVVQPYITGTIWSAEDLSDALSVMSSIYSANGITLSINSTITISDSQYATVSGAFSEITTSALVSQGTTGAVNLFFIEDYSGSWSGVLGNAAGIPGSMGIANAWNGVLNSLTAHASGTILNAQLLGETAAHEMGHQLGLFHTTEKSGTEFDIIGDTAECTKINSDNNDDGQVSAEECDGYGANNVMFWTAWSLPPRSAGKKQEKLSRHQQYVLKYSPLAK